MAPAGRACFWQAVNAKLLALKGAALRCAAGCHPLRSCPCRAPSRSVLKTASRTNLLGRRHSDGEEEQEDPGEGSSLLSQRSDASGMPPSIGAVADGDLKEGREHRHFFR